MSRSGELVTVCVAGLVLLGACSSDDGGGRDVADSATTTTAMVAGAGTGGCSAHSSVDAGAERRTFDHKGVEREYDLSVPDVRDGAAPVPLIVDLHGFSSNAEQESALTGFPDEGGARGYIVVTPQALEVDVPLTTGSLTTTFWNIDPAAVQPGFEPADDLGFIDGVLDELSGELCLDPDRFYATGMSNGAGMTMALICGDEPRFAAAAPVAGVNLVGTCEPAEPTPLLAFHGDADPLIPYEGGLAVGQDYTVADVAERITGLAESAGCATEPTVDEPFDDITSQTWEGCPDGVDFVLTTVLGGGHTWPGATLDLAADSGPDSPAPEGQEEFISGFDFSTVAGHQTENIDATTMILDFFDAHPGS